jgi:hypothetical protein
MKLDMFKITYRDRLNFNIFATFRIAKSRVFRSGKSDRLLARPGLLWALRRLPEFHGDR